ncbi:MAG: hypothetical protein V4649_05500 [Bacteroidota bacterium]
MRNLRFAIVAIAICALSSCSNTGGDHGSSTPIDSTNVNGTAPATYGGNNPANDQNADSNRSNVNDTGTKANNVHNTGY